MRIISALAFGSLFSIVVHGQSLFDGRTLAPTTVQQLTERVKPGTIVVLGEMHGLSPVRDQQVEFLNALRSQARGPISVGMEFVNYTDQLALTEFSAGAIAEPEFLKRVDWKGFDFEYYRSQILFPQYQLGEAIVGLNLSRTITSQIAKFGLNSLTPEQRQLMPPQFALGRDSYRERFFAAMGVTHPTPALENYFVAQCAWDDTMAWQAVEFIKQHPEHIFVIVVGEFHAQFGGGLPDRIKARMAVENIDHPIVSVSQIFTEGMTEEDIKNEMQPSPTEGPRGDFIWLSAPTAP